MKYRFIRFFVSNELRFLCLFADNAVLFSNTQMPFTVY